MRVPVSPHPHEVKMKSRSCVWLFGTPWTGAYQAPPSMGFSRQEYWSGLSFPSPWDLPVPGIEPCIVGRCFTFWATREVLIILSVWLTLILANLVNVKWYLFVALTFIFLIANDVKNLLVFLLAILYLLWKNTKYYSDPSSIFKLGYLSFYYYKN